MNSTGLGIAAVGFIFIIGAYVMYGPTISTKKKRRGYIPGLSNLGNSCFLNAVLQSVAACDLFQKSLQRHCNGISSQKCNDLISLTLLNLLRKLNGDDECQYSHYSAEGIIESLRLHRWIISSEEQDAHELYQVLMSTVDEELSSKHSICSLLDKNSLLPSGLMLKYVSPFQGLLASQLICQICLHKCPLHFDSFNSLSLAFPEQSNGAITLHDCLKHFVTSELVHNIECDNCAKKLAKSSMKSAFVKQLTIGKLPDCLCIHFQRTVWTNSGVPVKRYNQVNFPEYLYMGQYMHYRSRKPCSPKSSNNLLMGGNSASIQEQGSSLLSKTSNNAEHLPKQPNSACDGPLFKLVAVIVHIGNVTSGHYITYRVGYSEASSKQSWYFTSDTKVRKASLNEVLQANAYMLIYERTPSLKYLSYAPSNVVKAS